MNKKCGCGIVHGYTEVSLQEKQESLNLWEQIHEKLVKEDSRFAEPIGWHVSKGLKMIGFDCGQIRPDDLGRWDMYYFLLQAGFGPREKAAEVVGLLFDEIKEDEQSDLVNMYKYN